MDNSGEFKIEKGVPIKAFYETGMTKTLKKLEIGDSFLIDGSNSVDIRNRTYSIAKRIGIKIIVRKVEGGCRVWRVE